MTDEGTEAIFDFLAKLIENPDTDTVSMIPLKGKGGVAVSVQKLDGQICEYDIDDDCEICKLILDGSSKK